MAPAISCVLETARMSLTAKDKQIVTAFFGKVSGKAEDIGNEALSR
jgi:hypothetical protein